MVEKGRRMNIEETTSKNARHEKNETEKESEMDKDKKRRMRESG